MKKLIIILAAVIISGSAHAKKPEVTLCGKNQNLCDAIYKDNVEQVVRESQNIGVDEQLNDFGLTMVMAASSYNSPKVLDYLHTTYADEIDLDCPGFGGSTAFHLASVGCNYYAAARLKAWGADANLANETGETPLSLMKRFCSNSVSFAELIQEIEKEKN